MSATAFVHSKNVRATNTSTTWIALASALPKNARKTSTLTQGTVSAVVLNQQTIFAPLALVGALKIATVSAMPVNLRAEMISTQIRSNAYVSVMKFLAKQAKFGINNNVPVFAVRESALTTSTGTIKTVIASVRP